MSLPWGPKKSLKQKYNSRNEIVKNENEYEIREVLAWSHEHEAFFRLVIQAPYYMYTEYRFLNWEFMKSMRETFPLKWKGEKGWYLNEDFDLLTSFVCNGIL